MKLLVLKRFRDVKVGEIRQPNTVFEATEERFAELKTNLGDEFVVEIQVVEPKADEGTEEFPKHVGGGQYELSNGEKVKGKEAAIKAEEALKE